MPRFLHHCPCGKWGSFGVGVKLRDGREGKWYCREHRPGTFQWHERDGYKIMERKT